MAGVFDQKHHLPNEKLFSHKGRKDHKGSKFFFVSFVFFV